MTKIAKVSEVEIPEVPKFLRRNQGFAAIHIKYLSDEELREIGSQWTQKLIESARLARKKDPLNDIGL